MMLERWGGQARRGVSVMALRRVAVWPMCLMRPCLTKNVLIHGGNFRITFAAGGRRKEIMGGCVYHYVVPFPDWWVDGVFVLAGS